MSRIEKPLPQIYIDGSQRQNEDSQRQQSIDQAWNTNAAFQSTDLSEGQQEADDIVEKMTNVVTKSKTTFDAVNSFYTANQSVFATAATSLANLNGDSKLIEVTMSAFTEYCPIVLRGLDSLSQLHPFIGVATKAFSLVITMDLKRRENNKKVMALKIQMQDTMMVLFDLRHMKDPSQTDPQGNTVENRMIALLKKIAEDITEAGSACDHYLKKSFAAKTLKSMKYESRLSGYGDRFAEHRKNLKFALSVHTALGVDSANDKLDSLVSQNESMQTTLAVILRKLDTPREKEAQAFVGKHGINACLQDDQLIKELLNISGESVSNITSQRTGDETKDLALARKQLARDYSEDLDKALQRNAHLFERKMEMQSRQMESLFTELHTEGEHIISALKAGAHDRIVDADMQALWKENGWKGSVKARRFVLALQDYYGDKLVGGTSLAMPDAVSPLPSLPPSPSSVSGGTDMALVVHPKGDRWALKYIDVSHVQPILEAIDDDGTGFISTKEVNMFAASRPSGWSLPVWIAYWAAGWHVSIDWYKARIYAVIREMYAVIDYDARSEMSYENRLLPANRTYIDAYLTHDVFNRIDLLLRSLHPVRYNAADDVQLLMLIDFYTGFEENRLRDNLEALAYDIDTKGTVLLVTGPGRIERFLLPLTYLLLKRHLKVLYLAKTHVLDTEEFLGLAMSLQFVFNALDDRIESLGAIFKQTVPDVTNRLGNFAYGLLQLSYGDCRRIPSQNSLLPWDDGDEIESEGESDGTIAQIPLSVLKYSVRDTLESEIYQYSIDTFHPEDNNPRTPKHFLSGYWAGHMWVEDREELYSDEGLVQMSIHDVDRHGNIAGVAEASHGLMSVTGSITPENEVKLSLAYEDKSALVCHGKYDPRAGVLTGTFTTYLVSDEDDEGSESSESDGNEDDEGSEGSEQERDSEVEQEGEEQGAGYEVEQENSENDTNQDHFTQETRTFFLSRTPAFAWRFHSPFGQSKTPEARWKFACNAILDHVRREKCSWAYLKSRGEERSRYLELMLRREVDERDFTPSNALSDEEGKELRVLEAKVHPTDARFYYSLIPSMIDTTYTAHIGYDCDSCDRRVLQRRLICLECISDDFSDTFDLCLNCRETSATSDPFNHTPSHPMLQVNSMIVDGELAWAIPEARDVASRVKAVFRAKHSLLNRLEPDAKDGRIDKSKRVETLCCCCAKEVNTPCWVCVYCSPDTFICDECEEHRNPVLPNGPGKWHHHKDHLIRIYDAEDIAELPTTDARLLALENKLSGVESKFRTLEDRVEERFSNMENMLQQILSKLTR